MLSEKQKAEREASLGSSDAPVVAGVSSYSSPLELHYKLTGALPRYTDEETQAQRIGSRLEPVIAELAAEELGLKIRRCPTRRHPVHSFMVANLDYEIVGNPRGPGDLEIKNRSGMKPFDLLPDDITLQVVHQLAVTQREWAIVAVLFSFGVLKTYEVQRDKELEDYLIELEARFMLRVEKKEPPDHTWTPETVGILKKLYPTDSGQTIALDANHALNVEGFLAAKKELESAEEKKALFEGLLKESLADATVGTLPGYAISWKSTKASQKFDEALFKAEHPDLYQQFMKSVPGYRRFLIKPTKELVKS